MIKKLLAPLALVLILAACTQPSAVDLQLEALTPAPNATNVAIDVVLSATFNTQVVTSSVVGNFALTAEGGEPVSGEINYDSGARTATFTPDENLAYSTVYVASVEGVHTSRGSTLGGSASWSFTTVADPDPGPEASVTIDPDGPLTATVGDEIQLEATVESDDDGVSDAVEWTSNNEAVATVDEDGLVTTLSAGPVSIMATSVDVPSASASVQITVEAAPADPTVHSVTIDGEDQELFLSADPLVLDVVIDADDGVSRSVTVTVDPDGEDVVDFSYDPDTETLTIEALTVGEATITVTSDEVSTATDSITITVPEESVTGTIDQEGDVAVAVDGNVLTLTADVSATGGASDDYSWATDDDDFVEIVLEDDGSLSVTGVALGEATIELIAEPSGDVLDSITVQVVEVDGISIDDPDTDIYLASDPESYTLTAEVEGDGDGYDAYVWSVEPEGVIDINPDTGEFTIVDTGSVEVTATSVLNDEEEDSITLHVVDAFLAFAEEAYEDYEGPADITVLITRTLAVDGVVGGEGDLEFSLDAAPASFTLGGAGDDYEFAGEHEFDIDVDSGEVTGRTIFPGVHEVTVLVEDEIGQSATFTFELELGVNLFYANGLGDPPNVYTHSTGAPGGDGETVVAGDWVELSGVENTNFLPGDFLANFEFDLEWVTSEGPEVVGMFVINEEQGTITRMGGDAGTSYHEYLVTLTYDDGDYEEVVEYDIRFRRSGDAPFPDEIEEDG